MIEIIFLRSSDNHVGTFKENVNVETYDKHKKNYTMDKDDLEVIEYGKDG